MTDHPQVRCEPRLYDVSLIYDPDLGWEAFPDLAGRQPRPMIPEPIAAELATEAEADRPITGMTPIRRPTRIALRPAVAAQDDSCMPNRGRRRS
jgi:hypothetical protein